ncbi:HAD family hydrolase [Nocardia macrotermitis]|uniref:Phosphoglycolate phosphatase n=1 Tax=Nocardia macrotermitis TaxID=2585198 RepID=A0A7K0D9J8_9NOCA|nr:HAD family hydrolase [Nocardia macrotermitis]MQY22241.1 Phosphoglycolate phosphatase [Nocardia macrotermitis]
MPTETPSSAVLFDLDGTLLDTPGAIAEQFVLAVEAVTGVDPGVGVARRLVGRPLLEMAAELSGSPADSATAQRVSEEYLTRYREVIVPEAADLLFPGVVGGLGRLADAGLALAVVTSKKHASAELILQSAGIRDAFAAVVGADDVDQPKPHRASGDLALSTLGLTEAGAGGAVVGDTAADIGLGDALGTFTVGVTYGVCTTGQIASATPDHVAHTFYDVVDTLLLRHRKRARP